MAIVSSSSDSPFPRRDDRPKLWIPKVDRGYNRKRVIHITPPVDPVYPQKVGTEIEGVFETIITKLTEEFAATVEFLAYPRPVPLTEHEANAVLCYAFHISPYYIDGRAIQTELTDFGDRVVSLATKDAYEIIKKQLPDVFDVEIGNLLLDPITEGGSVSTCRLLTEDGEDLTKVGKVETLGFEKAFDALTTAVEPFVYQYITEPGSNKTYATVRLAPLSPRNTFIGKRGLARLYTQGHAADLARSFHTYGVTSNYNINAEDYFRIQYDHRIDDDETYSVQYNDAMRKRYLTKAQFRTKADKVQQLILGHSEFDYLLRGTTNRSKLYEELECYPRFWVNESNLGDFAKLYVHIYETNPWDYAPELGAPIFRPRRIDDETPATDWTAPKANIDASERHQTDGSDGHLDFGERFAKAVRASGDQITRVTQDGASQPDYEIHVQNGRINIVEKPVESDIVAVEPEWKNTSKFSNILTNVERAIANEQHVIVVVRSEALASRTYDNLLVPYKVQTERGAHLYTFSDPVPRLDDEVAVLMPAGEESKWYLTPEGELLLVIDGREVARCDAEADLSTTEYDLPIVTETDGRYVVTTPDGETLTYKTKSALQREYSRVALPHVPIDISYLEYVTLMYEEGGIEEETGNFSEYERYPEWAKASKAKQRYNQFGELIGEHFIGEATGHDLALDKCHPRLMRVYRRCTDKKAPARNWFSRGLPDYITRKDGEGGKKLLADHAWVFPRGLISPHLPGVDLDDDLEAIE